MSPAPTAVLELVGERLLEASAVAAVLALGVALLVRLAPALPAALRAGLWWLVAARTLVELVGIPAAELAVLPAHAVPELSVAAAPVPALSPHPAAGRRETAPRPETAANGAPGRTDSARRLPGPLALFALVALPMAALAGARGVRQLLAARRRVRSARPVSEPELIERLERLRSRLGVRRRVALARSPEAETPQVVGLLRPTVLLPAASELGSEELDWALAHELAHVRRFDALWAFAPFLAERLLVFHPLVRLAAREYALAVEAACDAVVLERFAPGADRYGRLLVRLAAGPPTPAPAAVWPLARHPLERRLDMLRRSLVRRRPALAALGGSLLLSLAIAVPIRLVAQSPEPPTAPAAPEPASAPAPEALPSPPSAPTPPAPPRAVTPPAPAAAPTPPAARVAPAPVEPGARWVHPAVPDLGREIAVGVAGAEDALRESLRAAERARRVVESSQVEIERARRLAESARMRVERLAQETKEAQAVRRLEIQAEMSRLQERLAEMAAELERSQAELSERIGAEMERLHEELARELGRRAERMGEIGERLERAEELERLTAELEELEELGEIEELEESETERLERLEREIERVERRDRDVRRDVEREVDERSDPPR